MVYEEGLSALVMDTDGVNFSVPDGRDQHEYMEELNDLVEKGKVYKGSDLMLQNITIYS